MNSDIGGTGVAMLQRLPSRSDPDATPYGIAFGSRARRPPMRRVRRRYSAP